MLEGQLDGGPVAASRLGGARAEEIALDWNFGQSVSGLYDVSRLDVYRASFVSFLEDRCRAAGVSPLDDRSQALLSLSLPLSVTLLVLLRVSVCLILAGSSRDGACSRAALRHLRGASSRPQHWQSFCVSRGRGGPHVAYRE